MSDSIKNAVRDGYGGVARQGLGSHQEGMRSIASAFGYSAEELASIPDEANMGLSCGNPIALATLRPGETVVDLGSGGGLDVFLASKEVGPAGLAIGIDMTADMVELARANAQKGDYANVIFHLAEIESMPIDSGSVDCVISNCVLNLCADKDAALAEVFRVLKPGGRLAISDIALKRALPEEFRNEVAAWNGCIGGALTIDENFAALERAGFTKVVIQDSNADLNIYKEGGSAACCGPAPSSVKLQTSCCDAASVEPDEAPANFHETMSQLLDSIDANDYAASVKIFAIKQ
ncbi:arsenite methyltransferase [Pseudohalioglobus lutimaris]|uniref:Arsenite methyltransferase n=1 Tax=Pseudohalioglobus lutimaris TaxID=1737061 RepID=A0A2N5X094_9GAMM|nr:arsenite methyltransferase [Pseudohalioglobus lutimaris]PLW67880.1 SAM-dependent methyltransferase [Pseudohalioglobus lutimaris]